MIAEVPPTVTATGGDQTVPTPTRNVETAADVLERHEAVIEQAMGGRARPSASWRQALRALRDWQTCGKCGRDLDPSDPVWWCSVLAGASPISGRAHYWRIPFGAECVSPTHQSGMRRACGGCGRPVIYRYPNGRLRWPVCSERCTWTARNRRRAEHLAEARLLDCTICGERFQPARSDALTCSSSCRQKAYRRRLLGAAP